MISNFQLLRGHFVKINQLSVTNYLSMTFHRKKIKSTIKILFLVLTLDIYFIVLLTKGIESLQQTLIF